MRSQQPQAWMRLCRFLSTRQKGVCSQRKCFRQCNFSDPRWLGLLEGRVPKSSWWACCWRGS